MNNSEYDYWIDEGETVLLALNYPLMEKRYGKLQKITGKEAIKRYGIDVVDYAADRCIAVLKEGGR